jgi:hypothetical protein
MITVAVSGSTPGLSLPSILEISDRSSSLVRCGDPKSTAAFEFDGVDRLGFITVLNPRIDQRRPAATYRQDCFSNSIAQRASHDPNSQIPLTGQHKYDDSESTIPTRALVESFFLTLSIFFVTIR